MNKSKCMSFRATLSRPNSYTEYSRFKLVLTNWSIRSYTGWETHKQHYSMTRKQRSSHLLMKHWWNIIIALLLTSSVNVRSRDDRFDWYMELNWTKIESTVFSLCDYVRHAASNESLHSGLSPVGDISPERQGDLSPTPRRYISDEGRFIAHCFGDFVKVWTCSFHFYREEIDTEP